MLITKTVYKAPFYVPYQIVHFFIINISRTFSDQWFYFPAYLLFNTHTSKKFWWLCRIFVDVAKLGMFDGRLDTDLPPCFAKKKDFISWTKMMLHLTSFSFNLLILNCSSLFFSVVFGLNVCFRLNFFSYIIHYVSLLIQFASQHRRLALASSWASLFQLLPAGTRSHPKYIMVITDWVISASVQTFHTDLFSAVNLHGAGSVLHLKKHGFVLIK